MESEERAAPAEDLAVGETGAGESPRQTYM